MPVPDVPMSPPQPGVGLALSPRMMVGAPPPLPHPMSPPMAVGGIGSPAISVHAIGGPQAQARAMSPPMPPMGVIMGAHPPHEHGHGPGHPHPHAAEEGIEGIELSLGQRGGARFNSAAGRAGPGGINNGGSVGRKPPCAFFPQGRCRNGDDCRFPHIMPEGRPVSPTSPRGGYGGGFGRHGGANGPARRPPIESIDERFGEMSLADEPSKPSVGRKPPCAFFPQGRCRNGDDCRFPHIMPEDGMVVLMVPVEGHRSGVSTSGWGDESC